MKPLSIDDLTRTINDALDVAFSGSSGLEAIRSKLAVVNTLLQESGMRRKDESAWMSEWGNISQKIAVAELTNKVGTLEDLVNLCREPDTDTLFYAISEGDSIFSFSHEQVVRVAAGLPMEPADSERIPPCTQCGKPAEFDARPTNLPNAEWKPVCMHCYSEMVDTCAEIAAHEVSRFGGRYGVPGVEKQALTLIWPPVLPKDTSPAKHSATAADLANEIKRMIGPRVLVAVSPTDRCSNCGETCTTAEQEAFDPADNDHCPNCGEHGTLSTVYGNPELRITECDLSLDGEPFVNIDEILEAIDRDSKKPRKLQEPSPLATPVRAVTQALLEDIAEAGAAVGYDLGRAQSSETAANRPPGPVLKPNQAEAIVSVVVNR